MVKPIQIETRERGMAIENRGPTEAPPVDLFAALETVRRTPPPDMHSNCHACFQKGAQAAVRAFDGADDIGARLAELRANPPVDRAPHFGADFLRGVRATLDAIEHGGDE
jgi:hypothetical protein